MKALMMAASTRRERRLLRDKIVRMLDIWVVEGGAVALSMMGHARWSTPQYGPDVTLIANDGRVDEMIEFITGGTREDFHDV